MNINNDIINILPQHFFGSLRDKMKMGFFPSETVEKILFPVLKDYKKIMPKLPENIQMDIKEILSIYPDLALEYKIKVSPGYHLISIISAISDNFNFNFIIKYLIPIIAIAMLTFPGIGILQKNIPLFMHLVLTIVIAFSSANILIHKKGLFGNSISITICCFLTIFLSYPDSLPNLINNSYKVAFEDKITFEDTRKFLWEKQTFGAIPINISDKSRAFAAGLYSGRHFLSKENNFSVPDLLKPEHNKQDNEQKKWDQTRFSIYYHIAQWAYLLKNICITCENINESFIEEQIEIINELKNQFNKSEKTQEDNKLISSNITNIENIFNNHDTVYPYKVQCKNIINYLNNMIDYYSPETIN